MLVIEDVYVGIICGQEQKLRIINVKGGDMRFSLDIATSTFDEYNYLQQRASHMLLSCVSKIIQDHSVHIQ
jgi:hypothetical protein